GAPGGGRFARAALADDSEGRRALLSRFARPVYARARTQALFDFEYTLEMYKPAAKRRWGYYALPVLHEDRLVGKVDAAADRKQSVLRLTAIHQDVKFTKSTTRAVQAELEELAAWLELGSVETTERARRSCRRAEDAHSAGRSGPRRPRAGPHPPDQPTVSPAGRRGRAPDRGARAGSGRSERLVADRRPVRGGADEGGVGRAGRRARRRAERTKHRPERLSDAAAAARARRCGRRGRLRAVPSSPHAAVLRPALRNARCRCPLPRRPCPVAAGRSRLGAWRAAVRAAAAARRAV